MIDYAYMVNGSGAVKAVPLSAWTPSELTGLTRQEVGVSAIYQRVPAVYRCVTARAHAVSRVPFELERSGAARLKASAADVEGWIKANLYNIEASLCLYGGAYLMPERNKVKLLGLRWLKFDTITPMLDSRAGLVGFERAVGGKAEPYKVEDLVAIWTPDPDVEIGPGTAPAAVALKPALTILRANEYVESFFERGGMNVTLLIVDPSTGEPDMKRLETWWKKLTRGVKKAWEAVAFRKNVEVKQFGYAPEQMAMPELRAGALREIANAFGVPEFYLSSDVANYATAENYSLTFNEDVIESELSLIETALNAQLLSALGLKMTFKPEQLEVYQKSELMKAQGISELVGKPVLSLNEGRAMLEREPVPGGDWEDKPDPAPPPVAPAIPAQPVAPVVPDIPPAPPAETRAITPQLTCGVKDIPDTLRQSLEDRATVDILEALGVQRKSGLEAGTEALLLALLALLERGGSAGRSQALLTLRQMGLEADPAAMDDALRDWLDSYARERMGTLNQTSADRLAAYREAGLTGDDLQAALDGVFGDSRARLIGITETTAALIAGALATYRAAGVQRVRFETAKDEQVCPVCQPLDGVESKLADAPRPPLHGRCRCGLTPLG